MPDIQDETGVSIRKMNAERAAERKARADRLFDRDARYAKWEIENDARPSIEERPDRIVETRGRCGIAPRITHLGRN